jgi:hypothetical protein
MIRGAVSREAESSALRKRERKEKKGEQKKRKIVFQTLGAL